MIIDECSGAAWRMVRGDSLLVLRDLEAESVDAVITDPPYSSGGAFRGDRTPPSSAKYAEAGAEDGMRQLPEVEGDSRDQRGYMAWSSLWLAECYRVARTGAFIAVFSDWRQLPTTSDALQAGGWIWRGIAPWCKPNARPQQGRPSNAAEFVLWGSKGAMPFDRPCKSIAGFWVVSPPRDRAHMTEKPVEVMADLSRMCVPGGTILDPFAGSGSTGEPALVGETAVAEGRRFVGVETSPAYYEIAARRLRNCEAGRPRRQNDAAPLGPLFAGATP